MSINTILFDMDGILIDSETWSLNATVQFLNDNGHACQLEDLLHLVGSPQYVFDRAVADYLQIDLETALRKKEVFFKDNPISYEQIKMQDAIDLLYWICSQGYRVGLATADFGWRAMRKLGAIGVKPLFDTIVTMEMLENQKPAPDVYLKAAERLQSSPAECLVIEDSTLGVAAAKAAGMQVVARINMSLPQNLSRADYRVKSLLEVKDILSGQGVY